MCFNVDVTTFIVLLYLRFLLYRYICSLRCVCWEMWLKQELYIFDIYYNKQMSTQHVSDILHLFIVNTMCIITSFNFCVLLYRNVECRSCRKTWTLWPVQNIFVQNGTSKEWAECGVTTWRECLHRVDLYCMWWWLRW